MNDVIFTPTSPGESLRSFFRNLVWSASSRWGLHGLWPWRLEQRWLTLAEREMVLPGLGGGFDGATLVHLSDLHFCPVMHERQIERFVRLVNEMQADFVAITGDFITASARHYVRRARVVLSELRPRVAALAVLGNHDYGIWSPHLSTGIRGLGEYVAEQLRAAGLDVLVNRTATFRRGGCTLHFAGAGELWTSDYKPGRAFRGLAEGEPVIGLVHNPDAAADLAMLGADYVLAGHTHGRAVGHSRLDNLLFPAEYPHFVAGEYPLGGGRSVYVNRGIGTARRSRQEHRPEVTVFTLRAAPRRQSESYRPRRRERSGALVKVN